MFRIRWVEPDEKDSGWLGDATFQTVDQAADRATQMWANGSASQDDTLLVWEVDNAGEIVRAAPALSLDTEALEVRAAEMAATAVAALRWY